ncbi:hypothetical protein GDO81_027389 [Engystomops pustulosus]|uniref:Uncharacterized protein n=1 Tax=Engystomops pustulosus TaxID=76066 RepID=A0AAV6YL12_ENGPU|nr:hypothetical protein GDO81_027389 [Engystomops pustulosus]
MRNQKTTNYRNQLHLHHRRLHTTQEAKGARTRIIRISPPIMECPITGAPPHRSRVTTIGCYRLHLGLSDNNIQAPPPAQSVTEHLQP